MIKVPTIFILTLMYVALVTGCTPEGQSNTSDTQQTAGLTLSAKQVTESDTLILRFPQLHPARLAVKDPADHFLILHAEELITRIMSHEKYKNTTSISLKISEVVGVTWIDGKKIEKKVFSLPGEYMIYMADNLETEPENTFYLTTTVNYELNGAKHD